MPSATSTFRIAVVGGGIGGMTAAYAMRGPNREVTIIEQSSFLREVGAAISLQPNATGIFDRWGLGPDFEKHGAMIDNGFQIFRTDGKRQMQIPSEREANHGYDRVLFHRVDLHDMLKEFATREDESRGAPATVRLSSRVANVDCEKGTIELVSGETLGPYDLIIGADGIHSKVRTAVLGHHVEPKRTGLSCYRIIVPRDLIKDLPHAYAQCTQETWTSMMMGQHCRVVMGPVRGGELLAMVALVPDAQMHEDSEENSWTSEGSLDHLLESFAEFPPWIKEVFKRTDQLGLWQLRDIDPLPNWVNGRVVLIGDAAHAMLPLQGQGASQSVEDAEALEAFFSHVKGQPSRTEIDEALKLFYETRKERATLIQQYSRQQARPATDGKDLEIKLNPGEFHRYNCRYRGALEWQREHINPGASI